MAAPDQMIALPAARSAEVDAVAGAGGEPSNHDSDPQGSAAVPGPGNGEFPGNPTTTSPSRRPRSTPSQEAPFAWQAKAALRRIVRSERVTHRGHALAVYVLLSLLQSDKETGSVTCTKGFLASQAGLGTRSVAQALLDLEALGPVEIKRTKLPGTAANAVNTYTLTSCINCTTSQQRHPRICDHRKGHGSHPSSAHGLPWNDQRNSPEKRPAQGAGKRSRARTQGDKVEGSTLKREWMEASLPTRRQSA